MMVKMLATGLPTTSPLCIAEENKGVNLSVCLIQLRSRHSALRNVFVNAEGQVHVDLQTRLKAGYVYGVGVQPLYSSFAHSKDYLEALISPPRPIKR